MFATKALMKQRPYVIIFSALVVSCLVFGYGLRIFESQLSEVSGQDYNNLENCIWNVIITMTSVGYGDFFPKTTCGRIVGIMICFFGVIIVSFFVVTVSDVLDLNGAEY
jgi:hypothetical protein